MENRYTVGSLFAGIGGIDLGLERTGLFRTVWFCERDPYCQRVLAKHWPDVPIFSDVSTLGEETPAVDVLAGGFPCQPVSLAGKRLAQDDERWLWPHVERLVRVLRPRGVLLENVPGLLTAGFDDVIGGLAACGYDAEWDCIPAAALGAPHRRDRVFVVAAPRAVADASGEFCDGINDHAGGDARSEAEGKPRNGGWPSPMAYAHDKGSQRRDGAKLRERPREWPFGQSGSPGSASAAIWQPEPDVGRVANGVPRRVDRLRALGNAVVPQVAEYVGHRLAERMPVPVLS